METVKLNIGGKFYETTMKTLNRYQHTRLGSLTTRSEEYNPEKQCFFFDRNPEIFNWILDYYRTGQLHFPDNVCGASLRQELQFWNIEEEEVSECCWKSYYQYQDEMEVIAKLKENFTSTITADETASNRTVVRMWLFLDRPDSSRAAKMFNHVYLFFVLLSSVTYCLASHPMFRVDKEILLDLDVQLQGRLDEINNKKILLFYNTDEHPAIYIINKTCMCFFTLELFFISSPALRKRSSSRNC
ncbi:hypothetical protein ScPMuIL_006254 [Solemya velum]